MRIASAGERVLELPANAAAAGIARRELASTPGIVGDVAYKTLLMTSELIAIYIESVAPEPAETVRLSIHVTPERVRIEVGGRAPQVSPDALLHSHETPALGGMGLRIVERMADSWGIDGGGGSGAGIWFELTPAA